MALLYVRNNADDGWILINSSEGSKIYDNDQDTRVQVEESEDEDTIRFDAGGSEVGIWDAVSLTMPLQPCFRAYGSVLLENFAINTYHDLALIHTRIDQGDDFDTETYLFTAPVDGRYFLSTSVRFSFTLDATAQFYTVGIVTSNRDYWSVLAPKWASDPNYHTLTVTIIADMDENDTAYVTVYQQGGAQQTDVYMAEPHTMFSGYKLC